MLLFANAVCDPAVGQATVIPYGQPVRFDLYVLGHSVLNTH